MRIALLGNFTAPWCTEQHLALSFEANGHEVERIQEGETKALDVPSRAQGCDLFVWVQTYGLAVQGGTIDERFEMLAALRLAGIPTTGYHLDKWFDLARADQLTTEPFFHVDLLCTADGGNQERFKALGINHRWMPPGVLESECVIGSPQRHFRYDVGFVGSWRGHYHPEHAHRAELIQFLRSNYRSRVGFWPRREQIRGAELSDLYASVKVIIGDSCMVGGTGHYTSDRIPETLGRAGFLLHPLVEGVVPGMYEPGTHLDAWPMGDFAALQRHIDYYLANADDRHRIRLDGFEHVRNNHTYTHRTRQFFDICADEGLIARVDA